MYAKAAENFQLFQDKGWLVQDGKENYYIYAQTMNGKTQYGLVVGAYVPDYMNGVIKLDAIIKKYTAEKPVYDFIAPGDGFGHTFWIVDREEDIALITEEFAKMPALYIADGHHRSAAAALVGAEKAKPTDHYRLQSCSERS